MKCIKNTWLAFLLEMHFTEGHCKWIFFTNHSGKRTSLYQAGIPEQEIMSRTGHRSVESVRKYKRPSSEMLKDVSSVLESSVPNSKEIRIEAADVCMNVPTEKLGDKKVLAQYRMVLFITFNLMK